MMKCLKYYLLIFAIIITASSTAFAAELSSSDLLNEFTKDEPNVDTAVIKSDISLPANDSETEDGIKSLISGEPSSTDYYNKAAAIFDKSGETDIKVFVDGKLIDFSSYDNVLPLIDQTTGRTMVPARALTESMGAKVDWDSSKNLITITLADKTILLSLNSNSANVNGVKVTMDAPAKSINGRTMIPLRFVSQNFGKTVGWNTSGSAKVISIYDN